MCAVQANRRRDCREASSGIGTLFCVEALVRRGERSIEAKFLPELLVLGVKLAFVELLDAVVGHVLQTVACSAIGHGLPAPWRWCKRTSGLNAVKQGEIYELDPGGSTHTVSHREAGGRTGSPRSFARSSEQGFGMQSLQRVPCGDREINTATSTSSCSGALEVLLYSSAAFSQSFTRCKNCSFDPKSHPRISFNVFG